VPNFSQFPLVLKFEYLEKLKAYLTGNKKNDQVPLFYHSQSNSKYDYLKFKKVEHELVNFLENKNHS